MKITKKILYYRDLGLLWKIFITSLKISFTPLFSKPLKRTSPKNSDNISKITKYVNFYIFIRRKLGFRETCLTHSLLLYHVLRGAGIEAKINFGVRKADGGIKGHCWITTDGCEVQTIYEPIFSNP